MKVKEIMHTADKIDSNVSISEAARVMEQKSTGSILIEKNDKVIGIITERDILHKVVAKGKNPDKLKVKDIMSKSTLKISIDLNEGNNSSIAYGCDMSYDYVKINSSYTT